MPPSAAIAPRPAPTPTASPRSGAAKQLEYTWTLTLAGRYRGFLDADRARARFRLRALSIGRQGAQAETARRLSERSTPFPTRARSCATSRRAARPLRSCRTARRKCSPRPSRPPGIGGDLDAVLSVDAIRIYKPRPEVYALVTERFKLAPADVVFVSSNRWDVMGAAAFGFRTAWINRARMPEEYGPAPAAVLADLGGLVALWLDRGTCVALTTASTGSLLSRKTIKPFGRMKCALLFRSCSPWCWRRSLSMQTAQAQDGARLRRELYRRRAGEPRRGRRPVAAARHRQPQGRRQYALRDPAAHGAVQPVRDRVGLEGPEGLRRPCRRRPHQGIPREDQAAPDQRDRRPDAHRHGDRGGGGEERARRDLRGDACRRAAAEEGRLHRGAQGAGRGQPQGGRRRCASRCSSRAAGPITSRWSKSGRTRVPTTATSRRRTPRNSATSSRR